MKLHASDDPSADRGDLRRFTWNKAQFVARLRQKGPSLPRVLADTAQTRQHSVAPLPPVGPYSGIRARGVILARPRLFHVEQFGLAVISWLEEGHRNPVIPFHVEQCRPWRR